MKPICWPEIWTTFTCWAIYSLWLKTTSIQMGSVSNLHKGALWASGSPSSFSLWASVSWAWGNWACWFPKHLLALWLKAFWGSLCGSQAVLFTLCGAPLPGVPLKPAGKAMCQEIRGSWGEESSWVALRTGFWRLEVTVETYKYYERSEGVSDQRQVWLRLAWFCSALEQWREASTPLAPGTAGHGYAVVRLTPEERGNRSEHPRDRSYSNSSFLGLPKYLVYFS